MHSETTAANVVRLDLGSKEFKQRAHAHCAEWALCPPFFLDAGGPLQVVCGRYDDVDRVFSDTKTFSSEVPRKKGYEQFDKFMGVEFITQMDGERHNRIRRLLMPAFSVRRIRSLNERIAQLIDGMLDKIEAKGGQFDGMRDYGEHLVVEALLTAMVQLTPEQKQVFIDFHDVLPLTSYTKPGQPFAPECVRAFERTASMVEAIIEERRVAPKEDFINDLIDARDNNDKLSHKELFDHIFAICGAALSATTRSAGGALYTLFTHPQELAEIKVNPDLVGPGLEECMRLASNGYFTFPRVATTDVELGGTHIAQGTIVRPSPLAANYDPTRFPNPSKFELHRRPQRIMSFGGTGPHTCIGNMLGRSAITIAITRLFARFPKVRLADLDFRPTYGGAVGELRLESLPLVWN
jgi:cytochrome P450